MAAHAGMLHGVMLGVGAGFDFHAGTVRRAPGWMQELCLEWLFRLMQDPKLPDSTIYGYKFFVYSLCLERKQAFKKEKSGAGAYTFKTEDRNEDRNDRT